MQRMLSVQSTIYDSEITESKSSGRSKKSAIKPEMSREDCVQYQIDIETENFRIMTECLTSGKHAEMKAAKNPV